MISPWTIYWLGVLESLQSTIFIILSVFTIVLVIHGINELTKDSEERKDINILKKRHYNLVGYDICDKLYSIKRDSKENVFDW